ncbi:tetratricopeptide repeat protein [Hyalangium sp.]|uniref:tetratricopeptide repeat protein n=1 Tax=Hyalangium sp. TaxID=2028555 RepID=UPI00389AC4C6
MRRLAVLLPLLTAACATTSISRGADCEQGDTSACSEWGQQLLQQGEKQQAENAFARSCEKGVLDDCTAQGQLMLERGELAGAEAALQKAHEAESLDATRALAELYQSRGQPGDWERVRQLRWEEPAIDKPDREFTMWWRPSPTGENTYAIAYTFQPMVFWARRLDLGLHFVGGFHRANELNLAVGYQHFLTPEIVPYATLLFGGAFQNHSGNVGGELGVKWCLGPYGHLNLGGGISVGSPLHASIGIGINSLPVDILLFIAAHAH